MYSDGHNEVFAESRDLASIQSSFITKVYGWMCFALSITGVVALLVATNPEVVNIIFGNRILHRGICHSRRPCGFYQQNFRADRYRYFHSLFRT